MIKLNAANLSMFVISGGFCIHCGKSVYASNRFHCKSHAWHAKLKEYEKECRWEAWANAVGPIQ
jgi:hypothetical protein